MEERPKIADLAMAMERQLELLDVILDSLQREYRALLVNDPGSAKEIIVERQSKVEELTHVNSVTYNLLAQVEDVTLDQFKHIRLQIITLTNEIEKMNARNVFLINALH